MKVRVIGYNGVVGAPATFRGSIDLIIGNIVAHEALITLSEPEAKKGIPVDLSMLENCNFYFIPKGYKQWGSWNGVRA